MCKAMMDVWQGRLLFTQRRDVIRKRKNSTQNYDDHKKSGRFLFLMATAAIRLRILLKNKKSSREEESGSDFFLLFVQKIYKFWG